MGIHILAGIAGLALILLVLLDAFETIVLPRRISRRFRITRFFYRTTWRPWRWLSQRISKARRRESFLSFYGPLSLIVLLGFWAMAIVVGFGLMLWAMRSHVQTLYGTPGFWDDIYVSGTTFFTVGLGDVLPRDGAARTIIFFEGALGLGFLGVVIGYLPVIYSSFSRREVAISLLDARAGSPPTAGELLRRFGKERDLHSLQQLLREWEQWAAELLESHLSYPVLAYFRSQHDNESWLAALTAILDTCSLIITGVDGLPKHQAELTFAMSRHALVDLAQVFSTPPINDGDRLPREELFRLQEALAQKGVVLGCGTRPECELEWLREQYEPYLKALAKFLLLTLPPFYAEKKRKDNWQSSAWKQPDSPTTQPPEFVRDEGHF
jgi:Ion channel